MSGNRLLFFLFLVLFRLALDASYVVVISQVFSYDGFYLDFEFWQYFASWIVYFSSFIFVSDRLRNVTDYFFLTAVLGVVAPLAVLYGLDAERPGFPVLVVSICFFVIHFFVNIKFFSFGGLPFIRSGRAVGISISLFFVGFLVIWYFISGVSFNLDFSKVYEFRAENADLSSGGILAYTNNWTYQVFNVFLMALALFYRRFVLFLLFVLIQVYFFAASTHKTVLFLPLLVFGIWFYFRRYSSLVVVPAVISLIVVFSLVSYLFFGDVWLSSLFSRRVFFVPAKLTFVYFDFFSNNPNVYWSNSVLSWLLPYPYDLSMTHVVGRYVGRDGMGANNGFIASGFAHAGLFGVILYVVLTGLVLRFLNDVTKGTMPLWLAVSLCVVPMRALLISSDLLTVMLTHGFLVAIILIYFVRVKHEW